MEVYMADRQRSFADMFPGIIGLPQAAKWKKGMESISERELDLLKERALTQEERKWKKDYMMKQWLDFGPHGLGGEAGRDPSIASQVIDYASMWPGNVLRRGVQTGMWDVLPDKIKKRIKRQMKEVGETRPDPIPTSVEALEAHEQVSDKMGYNPTDKLITGRKYPTREVGQHRSPSEHAMDLAGRFLQFLRDKDAQPLLDPSKRARIAQEEAIRREYGEPSTRRKESERFDQVNESIQARLRTMQDAQKKLLYDKLKKQERDKGLTSLEGLETASKDLMSRVFGRRLSRD